MQKTKKIVPYDGTIHYKIGSYFTDFVIAFVALVSVVVFRDLFVLSKVGLVFIGAKIANLAISPDLDLRKSVPRRHWGVLGFIWIPYAEVFKHRSVWTHGFVTPKRFRHNQTVDFLFKSFGFIIGTVGRALYVTVILYVIGIALNWIWGSTLFTDLLSFAVFSEVTLWFVVGMGLSDLIHTNFDKVTSKN